MTSLKTYAAVSLLLGATAIILPYLFGTLSVMALGGIILASGIITLLYVYKLQKRGLALSVFGPWAQILAGVVILLWPELTLWLVAVLLGGGLILTGITGLSSLQDFGRGRETPLMTKLGLWASVALGVVLILMGAIGSAVLLGLILGVALINAGLQQWREGSRFP